MPDKKEDFGKFSYIFGIISIVSAFFTPVAGLIFGIIGTVQSQKSKSPLSAKGKKLSKIGIILSVIMLLVVIAISIYMGLDSLNSLNLPGA